MLWAEAVLGELPTDTPDNSKAIIGIRIATQGQRKQSLTDSGNNNSDNGGNISTNNCSN